VTLTQGGVTVDGVIANGTYIARIVRPTDWVIPDHRDPPVVRAYDKDGKLIGEAGH